MAGVPFQRLQSGQRVIGAVEVQQRALFAISAVDVTVVVAGVAALLTGDVLALAFGVPLFGFATAFWPSEARVARWLGGR